MHLFDKGDGLSWDNNELTRVRQLHTKELGSAVEFLGSPSLADYLGLSPVESLHLPVPLNVILVGFAGDGNAGVNITLPELEDWFSHLDHILPHTRIDHSELSCQEDGQCAGLVHGQFHPTPMPSHVHLNFTCNVVLVRRRAVVDTFERAIAAFSRPVDPAIETGMQQVDASKMEAFVDHFIGALGLESSYSVLLLNPTWHVEEPVYGYRMGVSSEELQLVKGQQERLRATITAHRDPEPVLPPHHRAANWNSQPSWMGSGQVGSKFWEKDASFDSEMWVKTVEAYLKAEEAQRRVLLQAAGKERGAAAVVHMTRLLARPNCAMGAILRTDLLASWEVAAEMLHSQFHTLHPACDCLVNTWVGTKGRWALLDLTAGGKDWGPALGGDGTVHHHTLPHVHDMFGELKKMKDDMRVESAREVGSSEQQLQESLAQARSSRLPSVANRHHHAFMLKKQAMRRMAAAQAAAPGADLDKQRQADEEEERAWRRQHQVVLLQAELDLLEEWAMRFCANRADPPKTCGTWKDEVTALRSTLAKLHGAAGAEVTYELFRDHKWDIFGLESEDILDEHPDMLDEMELAQHALLGELSGLISRAIRHVIAPPTASWAARRTSTGTGPSTPLPAPPNGGSDVAHPPAPGIAFSASAHAAGHHAHGSGARHTTAAPFAYHVEFHVHVISDMSRATQNNNGDGTLRLPFDLQAYQHAVESLKMNSQTFKFNVRWLNLHDEPALASGMAAATRTTLQEIPSTEDFFDEMERVYVDSRELAATLRRQFPPTKRQLQREEMAGRQHHVALTIPHRDVFVFVLQLERDTAVLLDEHYNARALEDMVLVVANSARRDEHPTGMMCGGTLVARPISPLKEALAATLRHLGGVLPPHLGYNPRAHQVTHDWLWSVGAHPLSFTSTGAAYTTMQRDALARSYLLDALDTSVEAVNSAIAMLMRATPSAKLYQHIKGRQSNARDMLRKFSDVVGVWRAAVSTAYSLDYQTAMEYVRSLEADVNQMAILAHTVANMVEPSVCSGHVVDRVGLLVPVTYLGSALVTLAALAWAVLPRLFAKKAKAS